jgi:integrase
VSSCTQPADRRTTRAARRVSGTRSSTSAPRRPARRRRLVCRCAVSLRCPPHLDGYDLIAPVGVVRLVLNNLNPDLNVFNYQGPDRVERSKAFAHRVDAELFLHDLEARKSHGEWIDPALSKIPLAEWVDRWWGTTVNLKPKTRAGYESLLRTLILPELGRARLREIDPLWVREWVAGLVGRGLSASRVRQAYRLLGSIMRAAVESGYIARSPCIGVRLLRLPRREMSFLSAEQVRDLAEATGEYRTLVYVLAYGGLRWGEAVAIRRRRCDLLRGRIEVAESLAEVGAQLHFGHTKTYQARMVTLPRFLRTMLSRHLEGVPTKPEALVFTAPGGGPLRLTNFRRRVWVPALRAARLPERFRIHDLRHTCASLLIAQGEYPKAIQEHLGHSSIQVTMDRYGHLFPDESERLAEALEDTYQAAMKERRDRPRRLRLVKPPDDK